MIEENTDFILLREFIEQHLPSIQHQGKEKLPYSFLAPGGPYPEQWDWDAFFMALALIRRDPADSIWMKNWVLNYIENTDSDGRVAGCINFRGADPRLNQMKPFLAQGLQIVSDTISDYSWFNPYWDTIVKIVTYRERYYWSPEYQLAFWYDSMESGADNTVALLEFPVRTVLAVDLNTYLYLEYKAMVELSIKSGRQQHGKDFDKKAEALKLNIYRHLWNAEEAVFYNLFSVNGKHIRRITWSSFLPLWAGILSPVDAARTIHNYLLDPRHLYSEHGLRSLSKQDFTYNNLNIIKPHSNWQGPIWIIANYLLLQGMLHYGFRTDAEIIFARLIKLLAEDICRSGGMHENYDAETGLPLAAPNFLSWNILLTYWDINNIEMF
jgi:alpha,alpha-trehalase